MNGAFIETVQVPRYLGNFQHYYPGIHEWYARIIPQLHSGDRRMFTVRDAIGLRGLAITKRCGSVGKLCHISVVPGQRGGGVGRSLMQMALAGLLADGAHEIHVTTSEEVFRRHASFFFGAGFQAVDWQVNRYRQGVSELLWVMGKSFLETWCSTQLTIASSLQVDGNRVASTWARKELALRCEWHQLPIRSTTSPFASWIAALLSTETLPRLSHAWTVNPLLQSSRLPLSILPHDSTQSVEANDKPSRVKVTV